MFVPDSIWGAQSMINRRVVIGTMLAGGATAAAAHPNVPEPPMEVVRQVLAFREEIKAAVEAKDIPKLRAMYADTFTHTHGSGKVDGKDARILSLLGGDPSIEMAPMSEMSCRVHGDAAILSGRSPILNKAENKNYDFRWMQVYARNTGSWQLAASQATRLPPTS